MSLLLNRVQQGTTTTGTGTVTLDGTVGISMVSWATGQATASTTRRYSYLIVDGSDWELGEGVFNETANTLTRVLTTSSTGALLNLSGSAVVSCVMKANDVPQVIEKKVFAGGETSFSFTDIPQDFTNLELEIYWRSTVNAVHSDVPCTVNGLTTGIYDRQRIWKTGSGTGLSQSDSLVGAADLRFVTIMGTNYPAGQATGSILRMAGYTAPLHKTFRYSHYKYPSSTTTFDQVLFEGAGGIRTTAAITSIEFPTLPLSHVIAAGSYAVLRGIP